MDTGPPVCKGISSLCRPPTCQPVGGTTASAGGQRCHVPLLCKGQPSCHPVQVRVPLTRHSLAPGPLQTPANHTGCHLWSQARSARAGSLWARRILLPPPQDPSPSPAHPSSPGLSLSFMYVHTSLPPEAVGITPSAWRAWLALLSEKRQRGSGRKKRENNQEKQ